MSPIEELPNLDWSETAREEITITGAQLLGMSDVAYRMGSVGVVGLIYHTLTSPPWMWFALAKGITMRDLIDFRHMQEMIPQGTIVAVNEAEPVSQRFAEFYGFEPTQELRAYADNIYRLYRRT